MKKKRTAHSKDQPSIKKKRQSTSDSELVHDFIESLSDKIDDFKNVMNESELFESDPTKQKTDLNGFKQLLDDLSIDESLNRNGHRAGAGFVPFLEMGEATEESGSGYNYAGEESNCKYRYEFTNSEFLAFIAMLDPIEYLIVITLFAILISVNFNTTELEVIYGFLNNLADTISTIVEQEVFQKTLEEEKAAEEKNEALQTDFDYLTSQVTQLQEKIKDLEAKLNEP